MGFTDVVGAVVANPAHFMLCQIEKAGGQHMVFNHLIDFGQ